jgi:salicylate hydroxylase
MTARILIVGGGIAGLTTGIALRRAGFEVTIFEQAAVLSEAGAGISLSQAALSVYRALGLGAAIEAAAQVTADMAFLHFRTGALLAGKLDLGGGSGDAAAPLAARQIHRADLQAMLIESFLESGGSLRAGHRLDRIAGPDHRPTAVFANGARAEGDLVIGADGLKSRVRALLWGADEARFTGQVAYRFLVPVEAGAAYLSFGRSAVFQGPGRIFNRYTIRGGALINCVGIVRSAAWLDDGWSIAATRDEMLSEYQGWHPEVTGLIRRSGRSHKWGLQDRPPLARWSRGPVTLVGDAAHPMLPFLGLGAAMAIEDAMVLARAVTATGDATAFGRYEAARRPRTRLVQEQSARQGELVQDLDPDTFDPGTAPSHDPAYYGYDPVTAAI